ncbi:MAG TPA: SpvB/TcaC N-terminal domain-containing protein, partial [Gammaproteobacteria bacterium]|nr:SpvB/TcaC N-terminal domain-containing protein [Gammaproteobacteria bacterium]
MGIRISIGRIFRGSTLLLGLVLAPSGPAEAAVGAIPAHFAVTPTGAATYSIPINLPPGINGLTPHLGLAYSSGAGNGWAGYGWSLAGFSAITRCGKTIAEDGTVGVVTFTSSDSFCLDGNKLRLKSGTYGAEGATYRTEREQFFRITSHTSGGAGTTPDTGPQYFTVETPDGKTYEYGKTADARVFNATGSAVRVWVLDKITDPYGNFISFEYANDATNGDYRPTKVSYTGHGSVAPSHTVEFAYEALPTGVDAIVSYVAGTRIQQTQRLHSITVNYNGSLVQQYTLTYETSSPTHRSRLMQVKECGPGDCLPPTTISWQNGTSGFGSVNPGPIAVAPGYVHIMDVNGDGRDDLVYPIDDGNWNIIFGTASGLDSSPTPTAFKSIGYKHALTLRYNGDNNADLIVPYYGYWRILEGSASGFTKQDTGIVDTGYDGSYDLVDIDGDGLDDLVYNDSDDKLHRRLNSTNGFGGAAVLNSDTTYTLGDGYLPPRQLAGAFVDFKGGALRRRMLFRIQLCSNLPLGSCHGYQKFYETYLLGNGTLGNEANVSGNDGNIPILLNYNGDGVTDAVWLEPEPPAYDVSNLYTMPGTAAQTAFDYNGAIETDTGLSYTGTASALILDYNADGKDDLLLPEGDNSNIWDVLLSDGISLNKVGTVTLVAPVNADVIRTADFDGDGLTDIIWASGGNWHYRLHKGVTPDLVTRITDGLGNYFAPEYALLTGSVYTAGDDAIIPAEFPDIDIQGPLSVVSKYAANDPAGDYTITYHYTDARLNVQGRGFLGFAEVSASDSRNGIETTTYYSQDYRTAGMPIEVKVTASDGSTLSDTTLSNQFETYGSASTHSDAWFAYVGEAIKNRNDLDGAGLVRVTTTNTYNTYGELTERTIITHPLIGGGPDYQTTIGTDYSEDSANWCFGLPTQVTVARSQVSRKTKYVNNTNYCRTDSVTVGYGGDLPLTTTYTYGGYGNKIGVDATGSGLAGRHTTIGYGTAHDFPETVTNALGQITSQAWNRALGVRQSITDVNGHTTSWTYDDFGRKTREARPDGSETDWTYGSCSPNCGDDGAYAVTVDVSAGGVAGGHGETIYNSFGQPIEQRHLVLGGKTSISDIEYDAFGRKSSVSVPYFPAPEKTYCSTYTYDLFGRVTATDSPPKPCGAQNSSQITYSYTSFTTTIIYPENAEGLARQKQIVRNALGEITSVIDSGGSSPQNTVSYTYYPFGDLYTVTDTKGNKTTLTYNDRGMKTSIDDPDMGHWTYAYDAAGELIQQTDAKGQIITQTYDALGRLKTRTEPQQPDGASGTTTWTYDADNAAGLVASVTAPDGFSKSYGYDSLSRPAAVTTVIDGMPYTIEKTYDGFSRLSTVTYPESAAVSPDNVPVADAGPDQTVIIGNTVTLSGAGSDPDGTSITYAWRQTGGPDANDLAGTANATASFNPPEPGIYTFDLLVSDGLENGTDTLTVTVQPNAPASITASPSPSFDGDFNVNWAAVTGADCYQIQQSTSTSFAAINPACTTSGTSYSYYSLPNGTYYNRVRTFDNSIASPWSTTASASVTHPPGKPAAPTFNLNPTANGAFTVRWSAPSGDLTSYRLRESINGGSWHDTYSGSGRSWSTSGRSAGHYAYIVHACYYTACSAYSSSASEWVLGKPSTPAAPTFTVNYGYNISTNGAFTVSWQKPAGAVHRVRYRLQEYYSGGWHTKYYGGDLSHYTSGHGNGSLPYRVQACNTDAAGHAICSGYSSSRSVYVALPPGRPTASVSPGAIYTGDSYTLSWNTPSGHIVEYQSEQSKSSRFSSGSPNNEGTRHSRTFSEPYEIGAYYPMTVYNRVRACNGTSAHPTAACGSWSAIVSETVFCHSNFDVQPASSGTVTPNAQY